MFEFEQAIRSWRRHLQSAALLTGSDLDELESHLRDEVERLEADGAGTEAAFDMAVKRLGDADSLRREFGKNGSASRRLFAGLRLLFILPLTPLWWFLFGPDFPGSELPVDYYIINITDLLGRALIYLVGIWLAMRSRQWLWAALFAWILALPWILNYIVRVSPGWEVWFSSWPIYVYFLSAPTVLILSIFWVYPPVFALDLRRRLAPA